MENTKTTCRETSTERLPTQKTGFHIQVKQVAISTLDMIM